MKDVEILAFRADTKASKGLTAKHIAKAAELYDSDKNPAPLVFGHPTNDSPALGLISKARAAGADLFLTIKDMADNAVTAVRENRILGRSIAFWDPDHPSNPNPGHYSIRHLGLLGGQAPAIPGLGKLKFSAEEDRLEADEDPADAVVFAVDPTPTPVQTITEPKPGKEEPKPMEYSAEQIAELKAKADRADAAEKETAELKAEQARKDAEFAASEKTRRTGEDKAALDALVADGKVLPAERADLDKLFEALPTTALTFSTGDLEPRQQLTKFLQGLPKRGADTNKQPKTPTTEFNADDTHKQAAEAALAASNAQLGSAWKGPQPQVTN